MRIEIKQRAVREVFVILFCECKKTHPLVLVRASALARRQRPDKRSTSIAENLSGVIL